MGHPVMRLTAVRDVVSRTHMMTIGRMMAGQACDGDAAVTIGQRAVADGVHVRHRHVHMHAGRVARVMLWSGLRRRHGGDRREQRAGERGSD